MIDRSTRSGPRVRGTTEAVAVAARLLRRRMTPAEQVLWAAIRDRRVGGLKFRRQYGVGPFVLDFYCASAKLVVEVDGGIHDEEEQGAHDVLRTEQLTAFRNRVLRVRNEEIFNDLPSVLTRILRAAVE